MLAEAGGTLVEDALAHGLEQGQAGVEIGLLTAHHDGQSAVFGPGVPAGDRRVQGMEPTGGSLGIDALGQLGVGGGHVDEVGPGPGAGKDAARTEVDLLHVPGVAHHGDDRIAAGHAVCNGIVPDHAGLCQEIGKLVLAAGIDLHGEARLEQVSHHAPAHDAHTDEGDFFHMVPLLSPGLRPRLLLVKVYHKPR